MPQFEHQYYEERGQGFPILLLHGNTLDHRMWDDVAFRLAKRFRVITPDMAGQGQSGVLPATSTLAGDLDRLLSHLGIEQAAVCGLSMGGGVAISFALHFPKRCAALIAVDSAVFGWRYTDWVGPKPYVQLARIEGLSRALGEWLADPIFARALASPAGPKVRSIVGDFSGLSWLQPMGPLLPPGPPECDRLREIGAPALVVVGEHDMPDFQRIADRLAADLPNVRRVTVPGAGHLLPMERPDELTDLLLDFLTPLAGG